MSELIGGKEALIALANDQDVEYMDTSNTFKSLGWGNAFGLETNLFFSDRFKFRLKPRTISINDMEVPAPFDPKEGDYVYFICSDEISGYAETTLRDTPRNWGFVQFGAWRTEDEIKQVVTALRSVFKGE